MDSAESRRTLDLETVGYVPIYDGNEKLNLQIHLYSYDEFDFRRYHGIVIAYGY